MMISIDVDENTCYRIWTEGDPHRLAWKLGVMLDCSRDRVKLSDDAWFESDYSYFYINVNISHNFSIRKKISEDAIIELIRVLGTEN